MTKWAGDKNTYRFKEKHLKGIWLDCMSSQGRATSAIDG